MVPDLPFVVSQLVVLWRRVGWAYFVLVGAAALLAKNELDRLIVDVVSNQHVHSLGAVIGIGAWFETGAWDDWHEVNDSFAVLELVRVHTVFDLVFIACYTVLGVILIRVARPSAPSSAGYRLSYWLLFFVVGVDLAEDTAILVCSAVPSSWAPVALAILAYLKWLAVITFIAHALFGDYLGTSIRSFLKKAIGALYAQRLVLIAVVILALGTLTDLGNLFDQGPDAYRSWFAGSESDPGGLSFDWGLAGATSIAFLVAASGLLAIGRIRARRYASPPPSRKLAPLAPWYIFALVLSGFAAIVSISSGGAAIDPFPLAVILSLCIAIPALSDLLRKYGPPSIHTLISDDLRSMAAPAYNAATLLVAAWLALGGLGLFKAMLAPIALTRIGHVVIPLADLDEAQFIAFLALNVGLAVSLVFLSIWSPISVSTSTAAARAYAIARRSEKHVRLESEVPPFRATRLSRPRKTDWRGILERTFAPAENVDALARVDGRPRSGAATVAGLVAVALAFLTLMLMLLYPIDAAATLGPIAVVALMIAAWATLIGALILALGNSATLEVFTVLRLRSAPIVALLVVLPIAVAGLDGAPALHAVRMEGAAPLPQRASLSDAFDGWYSDPETCIIDTEGGAAKILVLVAAEGGGIRAATWTVDVMREFAADGSCAAHSVFASSGASGGSVGLASFEPETEGEQALSELATHSLATLAKGDSLGVTIAGLLAGDMVGGFTGIRVPSAHTTESGTSWAWRDRTALQELVWEKAVPAFTRDFDVEPHLPAGYIIMNSTDSISNCKVLISQIDLSEIAAQGDAACNNSAAELPNTIDLIDFLGPCEPGLTWSTAANLSARYPFVSPAGRISASTMPSGCDDELPDLQLVDAGVTDNSALGTLSDLAPHLSELVRQTNSTATGEPEHPFVVPVVVFVSNERGSNVLITPSGARPEILVPPAALLNAMAAQVSPSAWLNRVSVGYSTPCGLGEFSEQCKAANAELRSALPGGIVVVAPSTAPAVSVPLGWTLSSFSQDLLASQARDQANCGRVGSALARGFGPCTSSGEYGSYGALLNFFR